MSVGKLEIRDGAREGRCVRADWGFMWEWRVDMGVVGALYLCVKTIERAHSPKHMWERIKLSNNYSKALEQVRAASFVRKCRLLTFSCPYRITSILLDYALSETLLLLHMVFVFACLDCTGSIYLPGSCATDRQGAAVLAEFHGT